MKFKFSETMNKSLGRYRRTLTDATVASTIGTIVLADFERNIKDQGARIKGITKWKKLSDATIFLNPRRAGGLPLQDSGALVGSLHKEVKPREVSIVSNLRTKTGHYLANIHDRGAKITVTKKMRAYLHWKGIHLKKSKTVIKIPARKFAKPSTDAMAEIKIVVPRVVTAKARI